MEEYFKDKIAILRKRIPVGLHHGLTILKMTDGDVEKSEKIFQEECTTLIADKTSVSKEDAFRHLLKNKFDISLTLKSINEERFSISERILLKYKDKEEALAVLAQTIEETKKLTRNFWLNSDELQHLEPELFCLVVIIEWLNYENWEDLNSAIYFSLDIVIEQIEKQLLLPEIAQTLQRTKEIHEQQFAEQKIMLETIGAIGFTPEFDKQNDLYHAQRPLLIDTLYDFVKRHIEKYP